MGKTIFADLADRTGRLQLYVRKEEVGDERFARLERSRPRRPRRRARIRVPLEDGRADAARHARSPCSAKALMPLPDKWHGLQDVEKRYRQRYVDLIVNPDVRDTMIMRSRLVAEMRRFIDGLRILRGRDADAAARRRRRGRAAVRHPLQRARRDHAAAHRDRAQPQAADRRRARARLRDRPDLPQRRHRHDAQPRVHDARTLRRVLGRLAT